MKISTKVATGMAVAGLVGILGGFSSIAYSAVKSGEMYPKLVEIDNREKDLKKSYSEKCILPSDKGKCNEMERQYGLLLEERVQIQQTESYYSFLEERKMYDRISDYSGLTVIASFFLFAVGVLQKNFLNT